MSSQVSPGIVLNEYDFSDYAERISTSIFGITGKALKGPLNTVTLVTNERQLVESFGSTILVEDANIASVSGELTAYRVEGFVNSAIQYLRQGNQCLVVRAGTGGLPAITAFQNSSAQTILNATATSPGVWMGTAYENIEFRISDAAKTVQNANYFKLEIRSRGVVREVFDNLLNTADDDNDLINSAPTRINGNSAYVTVAAAAPSDRPANTGWVAAGNSQAGTAPTIAANQIYNGSDDKVGLRLFEDSETIDVNILAVPGIASEIAVPGSRDIYVNAITVAEARGDAIFLIDPPANHTAVTGNNSIQAFANGDGFGDPYSGDPAFNSSYAALYWPWIQVIDGFSGNRVWSPPSGFVAGAMAYTDRVRDSWWAPAGDDRGRLRNALSVLRNSTLGERETIYASGEIVNPIVNFPGYGIAIWGQKTTQRANTALNRVNVRRLLNYAKKIVATSVRVLLFEPNDSKTWRRFVLLVNPIFEAIKSRRGLFDFKVICDETTNPPELIDQNQMRGIILLKPTKTAEVITVDFTLLSTGASFNEFIDG